MAPILSPVGPVIVAADFVLMGATVVTDPAWPDARLVLNWP